MCDLQIYRQQYSEFERSYSDILRDIILYVHIPHIQEVQQLKETEAKPRRCNKHPVKCTATEVSRKLT